MSTHNLVKSLRADRSQLASEVRQLRAEVERAKRALLAHGFTDCGGAEWKPPLGPHPGTLLAEVERHQQTIHTLECDIRDAHENRDKYRAEVERLRAEANARAVEELALQAEGCDMAASGWVCEREHAKDNAHRDRLESRIDQLRGVAFHIRKRIAELSKPAAKESKPVRGGEKIETWVDDWTVSLADEAKATHAEEPAEEASAKLLAMVVEGLCNLGREVRRGGAK